MARINLNDTIVALSTPEGVGAIGMVRLSGSKSIQICDRVFKGVALEKVNSHTLHFGTIVDGAKVIDEVLVSVFKNPTSYTREDMIEVSCHGSPYILQAVISLFVKEGARMAGPGEFTMRAFLNGRMDLSQAEAVADLIASGTEAAHELAIKQMRGGYSSEIQILRQELINFASLVELELDFGEEDVESADRTQLTNLVNKIQQVLSELMASFKLGNAIKNGVPTVIAGRPNAGKSTLLNALLKEDRAIVSEIAGTTRDTIEEVLNIKGIPFRFIDTAGIRKSRDTIEAIGVEKTFEKLRESSVVIYLFDVNTTSLEELQQELLQLEYSTKSTVLVGNKTDASEKDGAELRAKYLPILSDEKLAEKFSSPDESQLLFISSKEGENMEVLCESLHLQIMAGNFQSGTVVSNARHFTALQQAEEALHRVYQGVNSGISGELLALDIRQALHALGEITGEVTTDDLLGNIFGNFCIGK